jgi:hypothetical protein
LLLLLVLLLLVLLLLLLLLLLCYSCEWYGWFRSNIVSIATHSNHIFERTVGFVVKAKVGAA